MKALCLSVLAVVIVLGPQPAGRASCTRGRRTGRASNIVLVSGDEEYRSEEALRSWERSFLNGTGSNARCCLRSIRRTARSIELSAIFPDWRRLATADLMVIFTALRDLPDEQNGAHRAVSRCGQAIVGIRTATHAFNIKPARRTRSILTTAKTKRYADGFVGRFWAKLGSVPRTAWVAEHAGHTRQGAGEPTRFCVASRTAISGGRRTFMVCGYAAWRQSAAGVWSSAERNECERRARGAGGRSQEQEDGRFE